MKISKTIQTVLLATVLAVSVSFSAHAVITTGEPADNNVGVPIDGGLLTILGAAGVAYAVGRKKKKNKE